MNRKGIVAVPFLAFTLLAFSSIEVLSKPLMEKVDPFFMTALRFLIGGGVLSLFTKERLPRKDLLGVTLVGALNSMVSMTSLQLSVKFSNASTAATLVASHPIFVSLFAIFLLRERYRLTRYVGIALGFLGVVIFSLGRLSGDSPSGIFFGILAAATFGLYTVLMRRYTKKYSPTVVTAYSSLCSALVYFAVLSFTGRLRLPTLELAEWALMFYFGAVVTGLAYYTYFKAMGWVGATQSSRIFFLKPIVATILAWGFLGEAFGFVRTLGMLVVVVSMML